MESYVPVVRHDNQRRLNNAAIPFAFYLNAMHRRIHPIFTDTFILSLDALPRTHPLNDEKLLTRVELVVGGDGKLVRIGVVRTSGVTAFDVAVLESVDRAQPFGPAPREIQSTDGNVYIQWDFRRDPVYACSTMNSRPYSLDLRGPTP
jgi:TonB family protein